MKWLFLLLVLANAGFIAWQGFSGSDMAVVKQPIYAPLVSEKIFLIDEVNPDTESPSVKGAMSSSERMANEINQVVAQQSPSKQWLCPVIGLERKQDRAPVIAALDAAKLSYTRNETRAQRNKYWLYMPAPSSSGKAQTIMKQLQQQGVDSYIVTSGEIRNRISLGLFSSQARAEQAQQSIAERTNRLVSIYEHQRDVSLLELMLAEPISEADWQQFLSRLDLSKLLIKLEKNPC